MDIEKENIIEGEFIEDTYTKYINGKPIYYKTSEVGEQLGETDSTIRFWCQAFQKHLPIETSGRNRRFKDGDIEKLRFIQKLLRQDGLSIQQVNEYLSEPNIENKIVKDSEPLPIQMVASATAMEVGVQLNDFIERIEQRLEERHEEQIKLLEQKYEEQIKLIKEGQIESQNQQQLHKEEIKEYIALSIDDKLQGGIDKIQNIVDNIELEAKKRDEERLDALKKAMDEREKLSQELEKEKNKGIFKRMFGR